MMLRVKVTPRSARTEMAGELGDGTLKVRVAAVPEGGRANEELVEFLAARFGVERRAVTIVSGKSATLKLIRIDGV